MNSTGCGFLVLAALALLAGLIPFLAWTNMVVTLPLTIIGVVATVSHARRPNAQPADRAMLWLALAFLAIVVFRVAVA